MQSSHRSSEHWITRRPRVQAPLPTGSLRLVAADRGRGSNAAGLVVRGGGLEPPRFYPLAPQTSASTNSAIRAGLLGETRDTLGMATGAGCQGGASGVVPPNASAPVQLATREAARVRRRRQTNSATAASSSGDTPGLLAEQPPRSTSGWWDRALPPSTAELPASGGGTPPSQGAPASGQRLPQLHDPIEQ